MAISVSDAIRMGKYAVQIVSIAKSAGITREDLHKAIDLAWKI